MVNDDRHRILLVQREHDDRDMYVEFLRHVGLTPLPVGTATGALRIAPFVDLIVTAISLPGPMDGIAFIRRLKRNQRTALIPIIALSACGDRAGGNLALIAGCTLFLPKPCLPDVLVDEIRRLLDDVPKCSPAPDAVNLQSAAVFRRRPYPCFGSSSSAFGGIVTLT